MHTRRLELLRAVVECGGVTAAAKVLQVSQPAVSQGIAALAREIGEPLFVRRGRGLQPTERARTLARAATSLDIVQVQVARALGTPAEGRAGALLRAGLAPAAGLLYGPAMLSAVRALKPQPLLRLSTGPAPELLARLEAGELDLAIAPRPRRLRPGEGLASRVMYVSHPVVYARADHPLARSRTLRDLLHAEWAVAGSAGTPGNIVEEAFRVRRWRAPRIAVQCADYPTLARLVAGSDLLGVIPHPTLVPDPGSLGIGPLDVAEGLPHYEVCLFWHSATTRPWPAGMAAVLRSLGAGAA